MSIANLFTENRKPNLDLKVNSINVATPIKKSFQVYEDVDWNVGVTVTTQAGRIIVTGNIPTIAPSSVASMTIQSTLINENSVVIIVNTAYQVTPTTFSRATYGILDINSGNCNVFFANPDDQLTLENNQDLSFDYIILDTTIA